MKPTGVKFTAPENEIVRAGVLAGRPCKDIAETLARAGFIRSASSINSTKAYSEALIDRARATSQQEALAQQLPERVVYSDLILRREVRMVSFQTLNGLTKTVPVSLSGGVNWRASA